VKLQEFFKKHPRIAVAFSGGVDSSYLLYAAKTANCDIHAYFIKSEFQPQFELDEAKQMAADLDIPMTIIEFSALSDPKITKNTPERCYHCKTKILEKLWEHARADGFDVLCDGTNADDDEGDRAGMKALSEQNILSPLRIAGINKSEIRNLSKEAGLFTHDKPAYACLATRIPTGTSILPHYLIMVEKAEAALFDMGFTDFRVRLLPPDTAKIQMPSNQWNDAASRRNEIINILKPDFSSVVLDLNER